MPPLPISVKPLMLIPFFPSPTLKELPYPSKTVPPTLLITLSPKSKPQNLASHTKPSHPKPPTISTIFSQIPKLEPKPSASTQSSTSQDTKSPSKPEPVTNLKTTGPLV